MTRAVLRGAAIAAMWSLALTARVLDAVRLELEHRIDGDRMRRP